MKHIRMLLACAVVLFGMSIAGPVFADKNAGPEKAVVSSININTADVKELAKVLINIGEVKAGAIVKHREEHGPFTSKEQLLNVKGIGAGTVKKNKALITL